jgi:hypothetical protein
MEGKFGTGEKETVEMECNITSILMLDGKTPEKCNQQKTDD